MSKSNAAPAELERAKLRYEELVSARTAAEQALEQARLARDSRRRGITEMAEAMLRGEPEPETTSADDLGELEQRRAVAGRAVELAADDVSAAARVLAVEAAQSALPAVRLELQAVADAVAALAGSWARIEDLRDGVELFQAGAPHADTWRLPAGFTRAKFDARDPETWAARVLAEIESEHDITPRRAS